MRIVAITESIDNKLGKKALIVQPNIAQLRLLRVVSSRLGEKLASKKIFLFDPS